MLYFYTTIIPIPNTVKVIIQRNVITISGNLGVLIHKLHRHVYVQYVNLDYLTIYTDSSDKINKSLVGTTYSLINGIIIGVTTGFSKKLQLIGLGYRVISIGNVITLTIGLSHSVNYSLPLGVKAICPSQTEIVIMGINKQLVGQVSSDLRAIRPPEPFKGKGIRYMDEIVHHKGSKKR